MNKYSLIFYTICCFLFSTTVPNFVSAKEINSFRAPIIKQNNTGEIHTYRASVTPAKPKSATSVSAVVKSQEKIASAPQQKQTKSTKVANKKRTASRGATGNKQGKTTSVTAKKTQSKQLTAATKTKAKQQKKTALATTAKTPKAIVKTPGKFALNVKAAYLVNMSSGKVYYEQSPDTPIAPASITKLMTLYLVYEAISRGQLSGDTPIPVTKNALQAGGSTMALKAGEKVPLSEMIRGISVASANNACVAVAEFMSRGNPNRFVSRMNAKAKALGMGKSRFKNPNGLPDPEQYSTARDLAKLSISYLRAFPNVLPIHGMTTHTYHGETHHNANTLLNRYKGVDGLKTGFVVSSGYNITATAKRGDTRLLAVVLGAQSAIARQQETMKLLDYGFQRVAQEKISAKVAANTSKRR